MAETRTLATMLRSPKARAKWAARKVLIWSGERQGWLMRDGRFSKNMADAAIFPLAAALARMENYGPGRQISFRSVPDLTARDLTYVQTRRKDAHA